MPHLFTMMTSSNGNIFRVTGPLCREFTGPGEFPAQRPVTRSFDVLFDLHLNKRLSKQPWGWWFETPPWSLWRQCNGYKQMGYLYIHIAPYTIGFSRWQLCESLVRLLVVEYVLLVSMIYFYHFILSHIRYFHVNAATQGPLFTKR